MSARSAQEGHVISSSLHWGRFGGCGCDPHPPNAQRYSKKVDSKPQMQSADRQVRQPVAAGAHRHTPVTPRPFCRCLPCGHAKARVPSAQGEVTTAHVYMVLTPCPALLCMRDVCRHGRSLNPQDSLIRRVYFIIPIFCPRKRRNREGNKSARVCTACKCSKAARGKGKRPGS